MSQTLTVDFDKPIALFPLPGCVLLPHNATPLHIFEPRYRSMVRNTLDASGLIAMATLANAEDVQKQSGQPPLREHVCIGYIVHHERLDDGRYNILLQGIARAHIENERAMSPEGYRRAVLRPIDIDTMEIDLAEQRRSLELLLEDPTLQGLAGLSAIRNCVTPELPTAVVTDLIWFALCRDPDERYRILSEPCAVRRAEQLGAMLRRTRRTLRTAEQMGPCTSEHGLGLN